MRAHHSLFQRLSWHPLVAAAAFTYMVYRWWSGRTGLTVWAGLAVTGFWFAMALYDWFSGHHWLGAVTGNDYAEAESSEADRTPPPDYPSPESWAHATPRQARRAARSFAALHKRHVPALAGPLFVDDEERVRVQPAAEVARRVLVLWAVQLYADSMPQAEARKLIDQLDLWPAVSPAEAEFLKDDAPGPDLRRALVWRLESIWVLMWALGYIDELGWPEGMCDVPRLVRLITPRENDATFISSARLRPTAELLDAQDLTMRIHWAIRNAQLHFKGLIPENLDWTDQSELRPIGQCASVGVVEQRHYALNWLANFGNPAGWDDVDTPT